MIKDYLFYNKIKNNKKFILFHIGAWLIYGIYIFLLNKITNLKISILETFPLLLPYAVAFYSALFCLSWFKKKGIYFVFGLFIICFLLIASGAYFYYHFFIPSTPIIFNNVEHFKNFIRQAIAGYVTFTAYALLYYFIRQSFQKEKELKTLQEEKHKLEQDKIQRELENALLKQQELKSQQEKLQFEYAFLRAQINPHFLYNTLNVLFSQAIPFSQSLADNIMKLSQIMRYSLESVEYETGKVSISKELEQLQTLIEIHNIRFSNSKMIHFTINGKVEGQMLPPLSLLTIVENAFKYGDLKDVQNPLEIKLDVLPNQIYFYCRNKKKKHHLDIASNNIGITNLSKRLDVAFKDKYKMEAKNETDFYTFELTINN